MDWFEASEVKELVTLQEGRGAPLADEARARLERLGAASLTDVELLAVLGVAASEGEVKPLLTHGLLHLLETPEVAFEVAPLLTARLHAAVELARRLPLQRQKRPRLFSPNAIAQWARSQLHQLRLEETWALSLNARNALLRFDRVGLGGADHCVVDPREALAPAVACRASAVVLLHTHPGGDPEPSVQDVAMTRRMRAAAKTLNISLLDHLVLADGGYVSMLERGLLDADRGAPLLKRPALANEVD